MRERNGRDEKMLHAHTCGQTTAPGIQLNLKEKLKAGKILIQAHRRPNSTISCHLPSRP